ncbi:site-specific DNA-methyltransferase [Moorella sulfitireducens]|uniref:site-specific DNA-methyltransferase n=1 Tax=Neomoorella sulfitireducens TaxID=2972948 RepID=UPI0021ABFFEB|nr:site-specific DNA-methyltransferase [Moorella sulfitireducens]
MRPDVGTQAQFRKKKPPVTYRYDFSLSPALDWDGQNPARELGEWLLAMIEEASRLDPPHIFPHPRDFNGGQYKVYGLQDAVQLLKRISKPFLNWTGKAEGLSFEVPTLPLFVHERLSTRAIIETLQGHRKKGAQQMTLFDLFGDPQRPVIDQILKAYEYKDKWVNRMILGDSLVVMNSLLHYEGLGGQVQMIYMDPPYGVKFGSNFQPFVRKRDVKHNDDEDMTREPEMVKAYRDTWELGLHSYLTYLRDRLLLCRELLTPSGSIFVQIGDENIHHVRELLEELFGEENFVALITFRKKGMPLGSKYLEGTVDYLIWFAKDKELLKFHPLFQFKSVEGDPHWDHVELPDGTRRKMTPEEINNHDLLPKGSCVYQLHQLYPAGVNENGLFEFEYDGKVYYPPPGRSWKTSFDGMKRLADMRRLEPYADGNTLRYVLKLSDYPVSPINNLWADLGSATNTIYVVQTNVEVVKRCILMTTDPGDLVLDPTCGSGTTAYVAEQWGRRWITIDVSRVPLALARQRLLTTTFPYYQLKDESRGPAGGFVYVRKQNRKGEEIGGIVPHITLESIANNEPPKEEILVDRPEVVPKVVRVTGPFCVEATIPTPVDWEDVETDQIVAETPEGYGSFMGRMLEILRKSPVLHLGGGKTVTLKNVRPPAKTLALSAEAVVVNGEEKPVAIVFGPENGAVSERLVYEAAREAYAKGYGHLYVIGFAIQPNARVLVENCEATAGIPATYVQATPDLLMGDLLKNMRSSQIFSVCGLPEVKVKKVKDKSAKQPARYQVELLGLDVFDPVTMQPDHRKGNDVPAWFLDCDYNGLCFHVDQAFFPRTSAWSNIKRALKGIYEDSVWDHLAGTISAPFEAGEHGQVAVKVIDDRGNELMVVKRLEEAEQ